MRFLDCALDYLKKDADELAPLTVRTYYWNLKKIALFEPELECDAVTSETVRNYKRYLETLHNKEATVVKALSVFRIFCNKMKADGVIHGDPFENVKVGRAYSRRGFLTVRELKQLSCSAVLRDSVTETCARWMPQKFLTGKSVSKCTRLARRCTSRFLCRHDCCSRTRLRLDACFMSWIIRRSTAHYARGRKS